MTDRGAGFAIESAETAAFINVTFRKNVRTPALEAAAAAQTAQHWRVFGVRGSFPPEPLPNRKWLLFFVACASRSHLPSLCPAPSPPGRRAARRRRLVQLPPARAAVCVPA